MKRLSSQIIFIITISLLFIGVGCVSGTNSQNNRARNTQHELPTNRDGRDNIEGEESNNHNPTYSDDPDNPRSNARQIQRRREHKQSMSNIGDWLIGILVVLGINILLAIVLSA
ncbi:MAG TPA: hypothetical protein ENJ82_05735 [Bacteroidetes bacterium]|nr:hypothetical protein [Bacteroidota bacterium]